MDEWAEFYHRVLGFDRYITFDDKDISTDYSALMSIVMSDGSHSIMFPLNEPAIGKRKSQIQEYIEAYSGPGVQHIALATGDAIETVSKLSRQGVEFLRVPDEYYDLLPERVGKIDEPISVLRERNSG
jgi:4-hydroxyphenylpyruvate dioxygenase